MGPLEIIIGIVIALLSVAIIGLVILQQSHRRGVNGVISGAADTFLSKNKAQSLDAKLAKITRIAAIVFFVLAIAANLLSIYLK